MPKTEMSEVDFGDKFQSLESEDTPRSFTDRMRSVKSSKVNLSLEFLTSFIVHLPRRIDWKGSRQLEDARSFISRSSSSYWLRK